MFSGVKYLPPPLPPFSSCQRKGMRTSQEQQQKQQQQIYAVVKYVIRSGVSRVLLVLRLTTSTPSPRLP